MSTCVSHYLFCYDQMAAEVGKRGAVLREHEVRCIFLNL